MPDVSYIAGGTTITNELQMVLRDTGVGIWCYDGATRRFTVDATCRELVELGPDEPMTPDVLRQRIHANDLPGYWAAIQEAMTNDGDFSVEYRMVRKNGTVRFINARGRVRPHLPGQPVVVNGVCIDTTELREIEQRLQDRTRELSRSNHDLEQFAYVATHDLKAPLRAIEVLVGWLREDLAGHEKADVQENLALLGQRASRMHRLLDDLLAYSRCGRGESDAAQIDSRQMVTDIGVLLAPPPGMRIEADASLPVLTTWHAPLDQVLRNLIGNAITHHPTKEGVVRVYTETSGDELIFAVEDDGAGIPLEHSEKVFRMFHTLKPREEIDGSGMGLAMVKRIVEWQGGRVWYRPGRGGRGTVFKFTWQRLPEAAEMDSAAPRRPIAG
jgi:signal transduction histidine kinase